MNKKLLETTADEEVRSAQDEVSENLEKTKQLMTYAQKNQQAKESYKPGNLFTDYIIDDLMPVKSLLDSN